MSRGTPEQVIARAAVWALHEGDSLDLQLPPECADAWIQDPPAGIGFMGKEWDGDRGGPDEWIAWAARLFKVAFDALKPGAHGAVWALPRTADWTMQALRRAGFEVRDVMVHVFGNGFPKSLDVNRAIDSMRADDPRPVCRFLRAAMDASGLSAAEVAERFGFHSRMVDHWAARDTDSQPAVPTLEQWVALRGLLGFGPEMDAEVARLNERKGQRGDAWNDREVIGEHDGSAPGLGGERFKASKTITAPATPEARKWAGWGTALKPSSEHWVIVRKPLRGTVAANVLAHGCGGINVDAGRVADAGLDAFEEALGQHEHKGRWPSNLAFSHASWDESACASCGLTMPFAARFCPGCGGACEVRREGCRCVGEHRVRVGGPPNTTGSDTVAGTFRGGYADRSMVSHRNPEGLETVAAWECLATCDRCGASALVPSGGDAGPCPDCGALRRWACPVARLDEQSGERVSGSRAPGTYARTGYSGGWPGEQSEAIDGNVGGSSRFFHCFPPDPTEPFWYSAKPPTAEREAGCDGLPKQTAGELTGREDGSAGTKSPRAGSGRTSNGRANHHPTVKGFHLIGHLCDLFVPPGGLVLDLTAGSGTLGAVVAHRHHVTGWRVIMGEITPGYCEVIKARCKYWGARPWRPRKPPPKAKAPPADRQGDLFGGNL